MDRRVIIGTAGHIDHGKTALVKALTGVDTDRWEEEKRRGISIDLGFAPLDLGPGVSASIVDVPGHEGFVRNMLAGATGIDVALLVIAADEGIMPQTVEHLAIVELLGVSHGIPVLTKADTVDAEWLELVRVDVAARLARSSVQWTAPSATSTVTSRGLDELRAALRRVASSPAERHQDDAFRLPIDRVFTVAGAGTVVTGTTWSGSVAVGEAVRVLPLDRSVRVRSVESHGQPATHAEPGRRTALALVGVDRAELTRGDVIVTGDGWSSTERLDTELELLASARQPLAGRSRVRVHLGTAEVLARVAPVATIPPGGRGLARLVLESPLVARGGDRFVLRSYSPVTTIGGGIVVDPFAPKRPRLPERAMVSARAPGDRLSSWVAEAALSGIRAATIGVRLGVVASQVTDVIAAAGKGVLASGGVLVARPAVVAAAQRVAGLVAKFHEDHPLEPGMSLEALRAAVRDGVGGPVPAAVIDLVLDWGVRKQAIEIVGSIARRPGWSASADGNATERLLRHLDESQWRIPTVAELEQALPGVPIQGLLMHLVRSGGVQQVDRERFALPQTLGGFRTALEQSLAELGSATPSQLRERLGLTRKYLIPLLEWADRKGITSRQGDARHLARLTAPSSGS